jgi:hypothetical protein
VQEDGVEADVLSIAVPHRLWNILEFASIKVSEYAVTGAILRHLPNLKSLRYELYCPFDGLELELDAFNWSSAD